MLQTSITKRLIIEQSSIIQKLNKIKSGSVLGRLRTSWGRLNPHGKVWRRLGGVLEARASASAHFVLVGGLRLPGFPTLFLIPWCEVLLCGVEVDVEFRVLLQLFCCSPFSFFSRFCSVPAVCIMSSFSLQAG